MKHFHYPVLDSTSTRAQELARLHPGEALLVSAQTQTQGRGRSGRPWASPRGGAWFTIAWPVQPGLPVTQYAPVPLVAGLAVLEAVEAVVGPGHDLRIKWPNDLLLEGRKVAGILCERVLLAPGDAEPEKLGNRKLKIGHPFGGPCLLIGVGINVNIDPATLGHDLRHPATSILAATGQRTDIRRLIDACVHHLTPRLDELEHHALTAGVRGLIEARLAWRDEGVTVRLGEHTVAGTLHGLDAAGRLELEIDNQLTSFAAGDAEGLSLSQPCASGTAHAAGGT